jgi:hypothetical protein
MKASIDHWQPFLAAKIKYGNWAFLGKKIVLPGCELAATKTSKV